MRSIRFLSIAFLLLAGFLNLTAADRKVTFPSYNILLDEKGNKVKGSEIDFRIVEVEVTSDKTIISCEQKFLKRVKAFFTIVEDCSIFYKTADGVVQSCIKASENMEIHKIGMNRPEKMPTHKPGEIMKFKMIFYFKNGKEVETGTEDKEKMTEEYVNSLLSAFNKSVVGGSIEFGGTIARITELQAIKLVEVKDETDN